MDKRAVSLANIQEVPKESLILLAGPPGAGKSSFCHQVVLNSIAMDEPVIFVTTEHTPNRVISLLEERGLAKPTREAVSFVDAFSETVGVETPERPDTIYSNCVDLNSISIAATKSQESLGQSRILLAFDSLTAPYLFSGTEVIKFMRLFLSKFAAQGNSVLALVDEGCGKEEDLVAMMSLADGIIKMEVEEDSRIISVVKHPTLEPTKIKTPVASSPAIHFERWEPTLIGRIWEASFSPGPARAIRRETGDFVNVFWRNLAFWSGMLWDPRRLPTMIYNLNKEDGVAMVRQGLRFAPWRMRLLMKLFIPGRFSEAKDMKRLSSRLARRALEDGGEGIWEYVEEASSTDEHYFRVYENSWCWGFGNVGARLGFPGLGPLAGIVEALEKEEREWNIVETKCIAMGHPYCELKAVPGETDELRGVLESIDSSVVERIHDRLMDQLTGFLLDGKPLVDRPRLGSGVSFNRMFMATSEPALFSERYRMALRMGGAKVGREVGQRLMNAGLTDDEAIQHLVDFMNYCKVGKVTLGETIGIRENCEAFGVPAGEPSCFFTTGFLNGVFSAVKNQRVREVKCIAAGDPYCEWEII